MHFGEYELSPSLIGLSLLPSPHPEAFQRLLVRSSIPCYRDFNLDKGRSLGFASASVDYSPVSDSLSLRLRDYWPLTSPTTATRRFIMQKARRHGKIAAPTACRRTVSGSLSLLCSRCFSPFPHGTIRYRSLTHIQPCRMGPADSHRISRVPRYSGVR